MRLAWPFMLVALLIVPVAVATYVVLERRRDRYTVSFSNLPVLAAVAEATPRWRRHLPAGLALLALALALFALSRPEIAVSVPREDAAIALTVDVSGSMQADDVKPTRLGAAQEAIRRFLDRLPRQYRVGLVTFSGEPYVAAPLTLEREQVLQALEYSYPGRGTAIGDAIARTVEMLQPVADAAGPGGPPQSPNDPDRPLAAILLLSDGAQTRGTLQPLEGADRAASYGIPVHTIALGTPNGVLRRFGGFARPVPPDPETLAQIAEATGGQAFTSQTENRLNEVYADLASKLGRRTEWREATSYVLGGAALVALACGAVAALWRPRLT